MGDGEGLGVFKMKSINRLILDKNSTKYKIYKVVCIKPFNSKKILTTLNHVGKIPK